jgi:hypothetical protein
LSDITGNLSEGSIAVKRSTVMAVWKEPPACDLRSVVTDKKYLVRKFNGEEG